ncbi:Protein C01B10.11 [Aphelenchoides avenae]|nr:Protein C01B10.11 [Aphelenchus avenae]
MCTLLPLDARRNEPSVPAQCHLAVQQIPSSVVASVEDGDGKLAAIGALVRYSNNQAYFVLQHLDPPLGQKAVTVVTPDENAPLNLKVEKVFDLIPDRTFMPMYVQVHHNPAERLVLEHLVDNLTETALGRANLELKKNVTIDLFDSDSDAFLRDSVGFMVSDKLQLHLITVDAKQLLQALQPDRAVKVEEVTTAKGRQALVDFDGTLSSHNRIEFLQFLYANSKVYAARKGGNDATLVGYVTISKTDNRVLGLYAESECVAEALLEHHLRRSNAKNAVLCTCRDQWTKLSALESMKSRPIYRRHTRAVPSNIKWERIFAINVGMNLF